MSTPKAEPVPAVEVPRDLNLAVHYVDGAVAAGHGERLAYLYEGESLSYAELARRVNRVGNALAGLGVEMEQRVAILLPNRPEFATSFYGAAKIGAVPAPISFAVLPDEQAFLLGDSRARAIVTTPAMWAPLRDRRGDFPFLRHVLLVGGADRRSGEHDLADLTAAAPDELAAAPTCCDDVAFWLCQGSPNFPPSRSPKIPPLLRLFSSLKRNLAAGPVGPVGGAAVGAVQGAVGNAAFWRFP